MGSVEEHNQQKRVLIVIENDEYHYLLYKISVKDLFYSGGGPSTVHAQPRAMRRLPAPIARFDMLPDKPEIIDFALATGGSTLIGVSNQGRTLLYDTASGTSSAGPQLQHIKPGGTFVLPLDACGRLLAIRRRGGMAGEAPFSEALVDGAWRALPDPPPEFCSLTPSMPRACNVTACVASGARVWVSVAGRGTYSVEGTAWRKEGEWELPFHGRGIMVPELGCCFGLCPETGRLCACDMSQSPPAVRYAWDDTAPCWPEGRFVRYREGTLAYLGDGRLCIAWTIGIMSHRGSTILRRAVFMMGVKVSKTSAGGRLRMIPHKARFYEMPTQARRAYALHADSS